MSLTPEQLETFHNDGVVYLGPVLNAEEIAEARRHFDRLFAEHEDKPGSALRDLFAGSSEKPGVERQRHFQFMNAWKHDDWYRGLLYRENLLDHVASVLGENIQLFHDQIFFKPAGDGAPSYWHQDNSYWHFDPPNLASIWIALDDVDTGNSCLYFELGSHQNGVREHKSIELPAVTITQVDVIEERLKAFPMPAGHALMHHCLTIHGAYANRSPRFRRSLGLHYLQAGLAPKNGKPLDDSEKHPLLRGAMPRHAALTEASR